MDVAEYMSPDQRIRRAAEILWAGIARWQLAVMDDTSVDASAVQLNVPATNLPSTSRAITAEHILVFLNTVGSASPKEVAHHFCISQSSAFRRLRELLIAGKVCRNGKTNALRYMPVIQKVIGN